MSATRKATQKLANFFKLDEREAEKALRRNRGDTRRAYHELRGLRSIRPLWVRLRLLLAVVLLALGYLFFSLAVNSGSLWEWTLTVIAVTSALRSLFLLIKHLKDDRKK